MTVGMIMMAAACAGAIMIASNPMAMLGMPSPITPFTVPASRKVKTVSATRLCGAPNRRKSISRVCWRF